MLRTRFHQLWPQFGNRPARAAVGLAAVLALTACSSVTTRHHISGKRSLSCAMAGEQAEPALVLWGTVWRSNQLDRDHLEAQAAKGLERYFKGPTCFGKAEVTNSANGRSPMDMSDVELLRWARNQPGAFGKLVVVRLEELGPHFNMRPSMVLWEGYTEVQLRLRVLDLASMKLDTDRSVQWQSGGGFVAKGMTGLEQDLVDALDQVLNAPL